MPRHPAFSIVINTDNRARSLAKTLESLRHLDYPDFEVCVVRGPTPDATGEVLEPWRGKIKLAQCSERNLAVSRNMGIAMSAGEIVAFIDDDAVPEPEWLRDLAAAYGTPDIDAAGGFVHDHTGVSLQWRYGTSNRLGESKLDWNRATPELNAPGTLSFPTLLGTNCSFRRQTLLDLGGFDEEYEYYLEETDLCCRLVDRGGKIAQVAGAYVHHQLRPGGERTRRRSLRHWYPTIKNKIYFSLVNGGTRHDMAAIVRAADWFVRFHRGVLEQDIAQGELGEADRARFNADVAHGWGDGLTRGLAGDRRLLQPETVRDFAQPFLAFTAPVPAGGRKTFCFLTQHYPPGSMAGVARSVPPLARAIAALGHHTHVLTRGTAQDLVDFEGGIWVHRIVPRQTRPQVLGEGLFVPQSIWNHAAAMLGEVERIATRRPIECVYAPLWDCEGAAIQLDGRFPLAMELHTPMHTVLATQPRLQTEVTYLDSIAEPIMALEKRILLAAARLRSNSNAITREIEESYGVSLGDRVTLIPHASEDWTVCPYVAPADLPPDSLRLLFVGRLEPRKGIDVLLEAAGRLLARFPRLHLDIVGNDTLPRLDGRTYRAGFEAEANAAIRGRVRFHGEVSEEALRGFYRACDVFVAPSRFESFGLILLEAMMFAKPVVCCRAGGMPEVVAEGETGLLAEPGDAASLEHSLERLIEDPTLRQSFGAAGRRRYEAHFTPERMARDVAAFLCRTAAAHGAGTASARPRAAAEETRVRGLGAKRTRIAVLASVIARYDAISMAVRDTVRACREADSFDVDVFTPRSDFPELHAHRVEDAAALRAHRSFRAANIVIYHFGIFSRLFEGIVSSEGRRAQQLLYFHGVTPPEYVQPSQQPIVERSLRQLSTFRHVDRFWATSPTTAEVLAAQGVGRERIEVIPLAVERPVPAALVAKPGPPIRLLFVGRLARAKGVLDLIEAIGLARAHTAVPFQLDIAGNEEYSDAAYVAELKAAVATRGLSTLVQFLGAVEDATLDELYRAAHLLVIPSYHEGFCRPVIEGLRAGCVPVGYAAYNLPHVAHGLGRMVPVGDRDALATALVGLIAALGPGSAGLLPLDAGPLGPADFDRAAQEYVQEFAFERVASQMVRGVQELEHPRLDR